MAIRVVKGSARPNRSTPPPVAQRPSPSPRPAPSARLTPTGTAKPVKKTSRAPVIAVTIAVGLFVLILTIGLLSGRAPRRQAPPVTRHQPTSAEPRYEPRRLAELGGLTMAEWESKHNTNNAMLEARRERMRNYGAGQ